MSRGVRPYTGTVVPVDISGSPTLTEWLARAGKIETLVEGWQTARRREQGSCLESGQRAAHNVCVN
jgi:hypothetical protein